MNGFQSNKKFFNLLDEKVEKSDLNNPFEGGVHFGTADGDGRMDTQFQQQFISGIGSAAKDFSIFIRVMPRSTRLGSIISTSDSGSGLQIQNGSDGRINVIATQNSTPTVIITTAANILPLNEESSIIYSRASGIGTLYINGEIVGSSTDGFNYYGSLCIGGYPSFPGSIIEFHAYNRSLTLTEVSDLTHGRPVPSLVYAAASGGYITTENGFISGGLLPASPYSSVEGLVGTIPEPTITATLEPLSAVSFIPENRNFAPGQFIRIVFSISGYTGTAPVTLALNGSQTFFFVQSFYGNGLYEVITNSASPGLLTIVFANAEESGDWSGTIKLIELDYYGEAVAYRPRDVTRSGRWRDSSGNNRDAKSVGYVTPLSPIESYTRIFSGVISANLDGLDADGLNEASPLLYVPPEEIKDLNALNSVKEGDLCFASFVSAPPTGVHIRGSAASPSDGQVPVFLSAPAQPYPITLSSVPVIITHIVK